MNELYLEVTYRSGKVLAAYLYLPRRENDWSVRVEKRAAGLLVDFAADDRPIGIEIVIDLEVSIDAVNDILTSYGFRPLGEREFAPLKRAA